MSWRLVWFLFPAMAAFGGDFATLEGTVRDTTQAVIPSATVTCIQDEEGYRFAAVTDRQGRYKLVVPEGHYTVVARWPGFRAVADIGVDVVKEGMHDVDFVLELGTVSETVTVSGRPALATANDLVIDPSVESAMPQNARTITSLAVAAPGMLAIPANSGEPGQISSQGARANSNSYMVDGIGANNAVSGGGWPSFLPGAKLPSLTALGTTHDVALMDSILDVNLHQQNSSPEFGSTSGAMIAVRTRSGSNEIHGSAFQSLRPDALGANDWFDNSFGLGHNASSLDDQGFSLGGPLRRGRTFFFLSGERLRLQQAYTWTTTVPSQVARFLAPSSLQSLLGQFPVPNGPNLTFGLAEYVASVRRPAGLEALNLRFDHTLEASTQMFLRLSATPSSSESGATNVNRAWYRNSIAALGLTHHSSKWIYDTRLGFTRTYARSTWELNSTQAPGTFFSQYPSFAADFSSVAVGGAGSIAVGGDGATQQDQLQISQSASFQASRHAVQFGADWFQLNPTRSGATSGMTIALSSPTEVFLQAAPIWVTYSAFPANSVHVHRMSGYAQDSWRVSPNLTVTYGLRWLHEPSPPMVIEPNLYQVELPRVGQIGYSRPAPGTPIWQARLLDFDPSASLAWRVPRLRDTVLRASWATIHDPSFAVATDELNATPYLQRRIPQGVVIPSTQLEEVSLGFGFASNLRLPVSRRWSVSLERDWTAHDYVSVAYLDLAGLGLLRREVVMMPGELGQISFASNDGASSYHALDALYRRTVSAGVTVTASYSWSHSIDLGSADYALYLISAKNLPSGDRGSSDFDVRHSVRAAISYAIPSARGWTISAVVTARTGFPVDVLESESLNGFAVANFRPDLARNVPLRENNPNVPTGSLLNGSAFSQTQNVVGGLGRNAVRGNGMWQADAAIERPLRISGSWRLTLRGEAYNLLNHPAFADPVRYLGNPMFGQSSSPLNLMMGSGSPSSGQAPAFQNGGPRSIQMSLRLSF